MLAPTDPIHAQWAETAAALGLATHLPAGAYEARATFKSLKRRLGAPAPRPSLWSWMIGRRAGREVLVCAQTHDVETRIATSIVARIDPPLFLGLDLWRMPTGRFEGASWAPGRTAELLARAPTPIAALAGLPSAMGAIAIMDSTVTVHAPRVVAARDELAFVLDAAANAASGLSSARRVLPKSEGERAQEAAWQAFASEQGLSFDPDRVELSGPLSGGKIRIALEAEPAHAITTVDLELPGSLGLGLSITKQRGPSLLNSLLGVADLPTGDAYFDEAFVVRGSPAVSVQQMLWNADVRRTVDELGRGARDFELGDARLFAQYPTPMATHADLRGLCDRIAFLIGMLFPGAAGRGPYR